MKTINQQEITIVICTFNRGHILSETLSTVARQSVPTDSYQVIIVDNNSTDNTKQILNEFSAKFENFVILNEEKQGASFARNHGSKRVNTDWIIFLDDDAKISFNFVETALNTINNFNFDCFGGVYFPWYKYGKPNWFKDRYASNNKNNIDVIILNSGYVAGGIMAVKKNVLDDVGGFPINIGPTGSNYKSGEDTYPQVIMRRKGYIIGFNPNWNIHHIVNRNRLNPTWFIKRDYWAGRDAWLWLALDKQISYKFLITLVYRGIKKFISNLFRYVPQITKKNYYWQNLFIDVGRQISFLIGQTIGGIKILVTK